jgi:hypothetical protein
MLTKFINKHSQKILPHQAFYIILLFTLIFNKKTLTFQTHTITFGKNQGNLWHLLANVPTKRPSSKQFIIPAHVWMPIFDAHNPNWTLLIELKEIGRKTTFKELPYCLLRVFG